MTSRSDYGVIFCGGGPAAVGPLIAAAAAGTLGELLSRGVLVIEPGRIGGGSMNHYAVRANSLGGAFLEGLDALTGAPFERLHALPETAELRAHRGVHPPLSLVGAFLDRLGEAVAQLLNDHPACAVLTGAQVNEVRLRPGGVRVSADRCGSVTSWFAERAVLVMGGKPLASLDHTALLRGLVLADYRDKLCHAENLIDRRHGVPAHFVSRIRETGKAAIVGGSHSAWSAAGLILDDPRVLVDGRPPEVTILHRSAIRLFYISTAEAQADGYAFDAVDDVCMASGRVNRYGGLRGPARALAQGALGLVEATPPIRLVQLAEGQPSVFDAARSALDEAGVVMVATGYQANLPRMLAAGGRELVAAVGPAGTEVTAKAHLIDVNGVAHPELLAYGLGAGLAPSEDVGGEASYGRRADGIWLYQHDVGRLVVEQLLLTAPAGRHFADQRCRARPVAQEAWEIHA